MSNHNVSENSGPTTVLRLRSPADVVAAVPMVLGFHPTESLVVIGLDVGTGRSCLAARLDMPPIEMARHADDALLTEALAETVNSVVKADAQSVLLIAYTDNAHHAARVLETTENLFALHSIGASDVLRVSAGRWWSFDCGDCGDCGLSGCCPPEGTPIDAQSSAITAAGVFAGVAPAQSRDAVVQAIAPVTGITATLMKLQQEAANEEMIVYASNVREGGPTVHEWARQSGIDLLVSLLTRIRDGGDEATLAEMARLALVLDIGEVRDHAYRLMSDEWLPPQQQLWTRMTRFLQSPLDATPAAMLTMVVWLQGGGALATAALERAIRSDSGQPAVRLIYDIVSAGMPPEVMARHLAQACRSSAAPATSG